MRSGASAIRRATRQTQPCGRRWMSSAASRMTATGSHSSESQGEVGSLQWRMYWKDQQQKAISPWHSLSMGMRTDSTGTYVRMLCEIPRFGKAKMEVSTKEENNPIAQDIKKGKLRDYHGPIFWNYGMVPQTWENPDEVHPELGCGGDNDPVDIVDVGDRTMACGEYSEVKILGCLAMIDEGEVDWKVLAISTQDPRAASMKDLDDLHKLPGVVIGIREWFRWYKTPDGKPLNAFGFQEEALPVDQTVNIINHCHGHWEGLINGSIDAKKLWVPRA